MGIISLNPAAVISIVKQDIDFMNVIDRGRTILRSYIYIFTIILLNFKFYLTYILYYILNSLFMIIFLGVILCAVLYSLVTILYRL